MATAGSGDDVVISTHEVKAGQAEAAATTGQAEAAVPKNQKKAGQAEAAATAGQAEPAVTMNQREVGRAEAATTTGQAAVTMNQRETGRAEAVERMPPLGGDPWCCLTDEELTRLLPASLLLFPPGLCHQVHLREVPPSAVYKALRDGMQTRPPEQQQAQVILWSHRHWIAANVTVEPTPSTDKRSLRPADLHVRCYDSGPSDMVHRDLRRLLPGVNVTFAPCPRQARQSAECGLFATAYVLLLAAGIPISTRTCIVKLARLRAPAAAGSTTDYQTAVMAIAALRGSDAPAANTLHDASPTTRQTLIEPAGAGADEASEIVDSTPDPNAQADRARLAPDRHRQNWIDVDVEEQATQHEATDALNDKHNAEQHLRAIDSARAPGAMISSELLDDVMGHIVATAVERGADRNRLAKITLRAALSPTPLWRGAFVGVTIQPMYYHDHYVAVVAVGKIDQTLVQITCYDSIAAHHHEERATAITKILGPFPDRIHYAYTGPQQTNDCAIAAANNLATAIAQYAGGTHDRLTRSTFCDRLQTIWEQRRAQADHRWHTISARTAPPPPSTESVAEEIYSDRCPKCNTIVTTTQRTQLKNVLKTHQLSVNCKKAAATTRQATPTTGELSDEEQRQFLMTMKKGQWIKVGWRYMTNCPQEDRVDDDNQHLWIGEIQEIRAKGRATLRYTHGATDATLHALEEEVDAVLPNPDIVVTSLTITTSPKPPAPEPEMETASAKIDPSTKTKVAAPNQAKKTATLRADPIPAKTIATPLEAPKQTKKTETTPAAAPIPQPPIAVIVDEAFDADDDSSADDTSSVDSVEIVIQHWTPQVHDDPLGRQHPLGHGCCTTQRPLPHDDGTHRRTAAHASDGKRRPRTHDDTGTHPHTEMDPTAPTGIARGATGRSTARTRQPHTTTKEMEVVHHDHEVSHNPRSPRDTTSVCTTGPATQSTHFTPPLTSVEHVDEGSSTETTGTTRLPTEGSHIGANPRGRDQRSTTNSSTSSNYCNMAHGRPGGGCPETETTRCHTNRQHLGNHVDAGEDSGKKRSIYCQLMVPTSPASNANGTPERHTRDTWRQHAAIRQDDGERSQASAEELRGCETRATEHSEGCPHPTRSTKIADINTAPLQRTHNTEDADEVSRTWQTCHQGPRGNDTSSKPSTEVITTTADDPQSKRKTEIRAKIEAHLKQLGRAGGMTWEKRQRHKQELPIQCDPAAIKAVSWSKVAALPYADPLAALAKQQTIQLWTTASAVYEEIEKHLHLIRRIEATSIPTRIATVYEKCGKIRKRTNLDPPLVSYCNFFTRDELQKEPPRQRGLFETLINDVVRGRKIDVTVKYTDKEAVREAVLSTSYGYRADMKSWFDELPNDLPTVSRFYGVKVEDSADPWSLEVIAMGTCSACRIAHTTLELLAPSAERPTPADEREALFVDNANVMGQTAEACRAAMAILVRRAESVGALVGMESKDGPERNYEFLGEAYCHVAKTRALTKRFTDKLEDLQQHIAQARKTTNTKARLFSARDVFSMAGTLCYAASVLDLDLTGTVDFLREHTQIAAEASARGTWHHTVAVTETAVQQLQRTLAVAKDNVPVHVTKGRRNTSDKERVTIYTDASRWGWGAIVISAAGVQHFSTAWTAEERRSLPVHSSVFAEPLAIRRALCTIAPKGKQVELYTDHEGLVWAAARRYSLCAEYNAALSLTEQLETTADTTVTIRWIPGHANPADALSRGQGRPDGPPLLPVTRIGTHTLNTSIRSEGRGGRGGADGCTGRQGQFFC